VVFHLAKQLFPYGRAARVALGTIRFEIERGSDQP